MKILELGRGTEIFYDPELKIIGRKPTISNLKKTGSDNSLYMGLINNKKSVDLITHIMGLSSIDDFNDKSIWMGFYGENVEVQCNINHEGQLQYKIVGNGKMAELLEKYENNIGSIERDKLLLMLDFLNNEIFFDKNDEEFVTSTLVTEKNSKDELKQIVDDTKKIKDPNVDINGYIEAKLHVRNNYVQKTFRNNLLVEFNGICALCDINKKELLHASHILPYSKCSTVNEMIDYNNGLLLCANHDALFDKGYITFDSNGNIMISTKINPGLYDILNISKDLVLDKKYMSSKRKKYLSTHKLK